MSLRHLTAWGALGRAGAIAWAELGGPEARRTDIDYEVFSDAAHALLHSPSASFPWLGSPYARHTYRYSPLLALLLLPNHLLHPCWGKVLFALADLAIARLLIAYPLRHASLAARRSAAVGALWLLNPFVVSISARGSSEALLGLVVLAALCLTLRGRASWAGVCLGLAVHLKLYPVIYAPSLWSHLGKNPLQPGPSLRAWLSIDRPRVRFASAALATLFLLNMAMYCGWGMDFVEATYLYHLRRLDHRHNFSPYFYPIYLSLATPSDALHPGDSRGLAWGSRLVNLLLRLTAHPLFSFVPQMSLSLGLGLYFGQLDLPFSWFIQTMAFVSFNKVITSQYFMWYLWFLPLLIDKIHLKPFKLIWLASIWVLSQALWLSQAYKLEFLGQPTLQSLWLCSIGFLISNGYIIRELILAFSAADVHSLAMEPKEA